MTSTEVKDFIFHSAYNTFKIVTTGTAQFNIVHNSTNETTYTIGHGLGYRPFAIAFCKFPDGYVSGVGGWQRNGANLWFTNLRVTSTNLVFCFFNSTGSTQTVTVRYYLVEAPV
ncbi:MAG: hypothetical protein H5T71_00455 [Chloroflexi bacterium]|nr:hypothetical protein [Chloroflexota bacterium]